MKRRYVSLGLLLVAMVARAHQQQDAPSPFDKCRMVTSADLKDAKAPRFATYRVVPAKSRANAQLDLRSNPIAREYRTILRQELAQGPNFAGHYRVAVWGCGSSCAMFAVIDTDTGRVMTPRGFSHTSGVYFGVDNRRLFPEAQGDYGLFAFRRDSQLLVVLGDLDEDESREGAFYFVLDGDRLKPVHTTAVNKDCERLRRQH
ncbi:MAG: hypothetical protein WA621_07420 [Candidatus Acidiferrum sp.]|jgi:hypothetical protein